MANNTQKGNALIGIVGFPRRLLQEWSDDGQSDEEAAGDQRRHHIALTSRE